MLEGLNQRTNIKGLVLEQPKVSRTFDPDIDITGFDWMNISNELLRDNWGNPIKESFFASAAYCQILKPGLLADLRIDQTLKGNMVSFYRDRQEAGLPNFLGIITHLARFKILFPDNLDELAVHKNKLDDFGFAREMLKVDPNKTYKHAGDYTIALGRRDDYIYTDRFFDLFKSKYEKERKPDDLFRFARQPEEFSELGKNLRLLFPEKFDPAFITPQDWTKMRNTLTDQRSAFLSDPSFLGKYLNIAANMYILAAHKVEITDRTLEIMFHPPTVDLNQATQQIPERRRF